MAPGYCTITPIPVNKLGKAKRGLGLGGWGGVADSQKQRVPHARHSFLQNEPNYRVLVVVSWGYIVGKLGVGGSHTVCGPGGRRMDKTVQV